MTPRALRWDGYVTKMGRTMDTNRFFVENPTGKLPFGSTRSIHEN